MHGELSAEHCKKGKGVCDIQHDHIHSYVDLEWSLSEHFVPSIVVLQGRREGGCWGFQETPFKIIVPIKLKRSSYCKLNWCLR